MAFLCAVAAPLSVGADGNGPVEVDRIAGIYTGQPAGTVIGQAVQQ